MKQIELSDSRHVGEKPHFLAIQRPVILLLVNLVMVGIIAVINYLLGYDLSMAAPYVIPVSLVSWGVGRKAGFMVSSVSAAAVLLANEMTRPSGVNFLYPASNAGQNLCLFVMIAWLVAGRKQAQVRREKLMNQLQESAILRGAQPHGRGDSRYVGAGVHRHRDSA